MNLYPYQEEALRAWATAREVAPRSRPFGGVISLPTGTGKTRTGIALARALGRALWLVERVGLVDQALEAHRALGLGGASRLAHARPDAAFVAATVQSVGSSRGAERLARVHAASPFALVVVDEAHHSAAPTYMRALAALGDTPRLGLTATPWRSDGQGLFGGVGPFPDGVVYRMRIADAIAGGHLVPPEPVRVELAALDRDLGRGRDGDVLLDRLEAAVLEERAVACVAEAVSRHCRDLVRSIVFAVSVAHAERIAEACVERDLDARAVHGGMPRDAIEETLAWHQSARGRVLVNCALLTEGHDDPPVDGIVVARPTRAKSLYVQMVGRGLRRAEGKTRCRVVDLVGAHAAHGLAGSDAMLEYDEALEREARQRATAAEAAAAGTAAEQRTRALLRAMRDGLEVVEVAGSEATWVPQRDGGTALPLSDGAVLVVRTRTGYEAWRCAKGTPAAYLGDAADLPALQRRVEARLSPRDVAYCSPAAAWRRRRATPKQRDAAARAGVELPPGACAGDASDLLTLRMLAFYRRALDAARSSRASALKLRWESY